MGTDLRPGADGLPDRRLPPLHQGLEEGPAERAARVEQPEPHPRPAAARAGRRPASGSTSRTWTACSSTRTRCTSTASATSRARTARTCRASRAATPTSSTAGPGPTQLTALPQSRGRLALPRPRADMDESLLGGMYGMLSILGRHERPPDREFEVVFAPMGQFQTIDGRAFVGNTPVFTAKVGQRVQWDVMAIGSEHHTFHVHGHRWVAPDGRDVDTQTRRPRRVVQDPVEGGGPRHVALPLPRRVAHDGRDDRHLPRDAVRALALRRCSCCWRRRPRRGRRRWTPGSRSPPSSRPDIQVLTGDTVTWINDSVRAHTVNADDGSWASPEMVAADRLLAHVRRAPAPCRTTAGCTPSCAARWTWPTLLHRPAVRARGRRARVPAARAHGAAAADAADHRGRHRARASRPVASATVGDGRHVRRRGHAEPTRRPTAPWRARTPARRSR